MSVRVQIATSQTVAMLFAGTTAKYQPSKSGLPGNDERGACCRFKEELIAFCGMAPLFDAVPEFIPRGVDR